MKINYSQSVISESVLFLSGTEISIFDSRSRIFVNFWQLAWQIPKKPTPDLKPSWLLTFFHIWKLLFKFYSAPEITCSNAFAHNQWTGSSSTRQYIWTFFACLLDPIKSPKKWPDYFQDNDCRHITTIHFSFFSFAGLASGNSRAGCRRRVSKRSRCFSRGEDKEPRLIARELVRLTPLALSVSGVSSIAGNFAIVGVQRAYNRDEHVLAICQPSPGQGARNARVALLPPLLPLYDCNDARVTFRERPPRVQSSPGIYSFTGNLFRAKRSFRERAPPFRTLFTCNAKSRVSQSCDRFS